MIVPSNFINQNQKKITRITKNQTEDFNKYIVVPERDFTFDIHDANEFLSQIPVSVYDDTDDDTDEIQGEYSDRGTVFKKKKKP